MSFLAFSVKRCGSNSNDFLAFLHAVHGRSAVLKLTTDEAAQVTSLFLRASTNNAPRHLHYHEFLMCVSTIPSKLQKFDTNPFFLLNQVH
jgi:hypothetical protein